MIETGYVDIHTHVIPGVDDGSANMERSMEMVRMAYDEGVRTMFATPHFGVRNPEFDWDKSEKNFKELQRLVKKEYPDLELRYGSEVYSGPGMLSGLADGYAKMMSENKHVMVEFSSRSDYDEVFHGCRSLIREGYIPILAHAERYRAAFRKIKDVEDIVKQGVLVQMNTTSVLSEEEFVSILPEWKMLYEDESFLERSFRKKADKEQLKFCHHLITEGLVNFIGTDCHDMRGRKPLVKKPYDVVCRIAGEDTADNLFRNNAIEILL